MLYPFCMYKERGIILLPLNTKLLPLNYRRD
jgi:hypothetical protein